MYSYGHPGSFNPAVVGKKEAYMIYGNMNNETGSSQSAAFCKKTRSNIRARLKIEAFTELLQKKRRHILVHTIKNLNQYGQF